MEFRIDSGLVRQLKKMGKTDGIQKAVKLNGSEMERTMKNVSPVDTGFLRRSITSSISSYEARVEPTAEYAAYVEYGTRKRYATPFVRPAMKMQEPKFIKDINDLLK